MAIKFDELLEALNLDEDNKNSNKTVYWLPKNVIKDLRSEDNWEKKREPAKLKKGSFSYLSNDGAEYDFELDKKYGDDCYILNGFELSFIGERKDIRAKALKIGEDKNENEIFLIFFIKKDSDDYFFGWPRDICEILVNKYYNSSKKYEDSAVKDDFEVALDIINKNPELAKDYVEKILFDNGYFEDSDDYNLAMEDPIDTIQLYIKDGSFDAEEFLDFCNEDLNEQALKTDKSLNESNFDKSTSMISRIARMIEEELPRYDVIYTDNIIRVSNGTNDATFTVRANQITKYTLVSNIFGDDITNISNIKSSSEFVEDCALSIINYLKDN